MSEENGRAKLAELLESSPITMFTTVDEAGRLISRPMAHQQVDDDADLWFFAKRTSRLATHIARDPHVNVTVSSGSAWVSVDGEAIVVNDIAIKKDLWNVQVEAWLPEGPESAEALLIKVSPDTGEYWNSPGSRISTALSFVKAKLTNKPLDLGEHDTVDL